MLYSISIENNRDNNIGTCFKAFISNEMEMREREKKIEKTPV